MFKAIGAVAIAALAFQGETLRTSKDTHETFCLSDSGCLDMQNCNWSTDGGWWSKG